MPQGCGDGVADVGGVAAAAATVFFAGTGGCLAAAVFVLLAVLSGFPAVAVVGSFSIGRAEHFARNSAFALLSSSAFERSAAFILYFFAAAFVTFSGTPSLFNVSICNASVPQAGSILPATLGSIEEVDIDPVVSEPSCAQPVISIDTEIVAAANAERVVISGTPRNELFFSFTPTLI